MTDNIERGAAEEGAGSPVTPTEVEASKKAPSDSGSDSGSDGPELKEHDKADSASGTDA
ncbi:hypothetical protein [Actinoplanes sp. URMC 104]|uniref:hypothetical protein n=1 Tax=Actinoplanes sp. URMC 104 TaxID=3423409 RepID=UPI003F1B1D8D